MLPRDRDRLAAPERLRRQRHSLPDHYDRERERARDRARKSATVELTILLRGESAILGPSPAGPDRCPPWCPYCSRLKDFRGLESA